MLSNQLKKDFPDRIKGDIITQDNLKRDIASLSNIDEETRIRFEYLKNEFEVDGILKPDYENENSVNDLANKFFLLQEQVRKNQRMNLQNSKLS